MCIFISCFIVLYSYGLCRVIKGSFIRAFLSKVLAVHCVYLFLSVVKMA